MQTTAFMIYKEVLENCIDIAESIIKLEEKYNHIPC